MRSQRKSAVTFLTLVTLLMIAPGTYAQQPQSARPREILVANPPPNLLARLELFGYAYEAVEGNLYRLVVPRTSDAYEVLRGLEQEFPNVGFAVRGGDN